MLTQLFDPAAPGGRLLLASRRGFLAQDRFPDLVAAAAQLPDTRDGEVVVWDTEASHLSFGALQRRAAARGRATTALAVKTVPPGCGGDTSCMD
ncbi:hypothetical protein [Streptomyces sp. NBC_01244]|uniref:hypothetical protein n=1 Tax=Streptomyces sp. NBC_01244 TaxID=2903797 RepID=UPI002E14D458|nr:hypothetical protein OG247_41740 [Streptomyces sp. NBC_01244]